MVQDFGVLYIYQIIEIKSLLSLYVLKFKTFRENPRLIHRTPLWLQFGFQALR